MLPEHESFILIVDDNPKNLQILGNILRIHHYKTAVAKDGKKALDIVQRRLPDLILLDIMMPEMDGFEVCQQLKAQDSTRDIPVIFISALTETTEKLKGFQVGGVDYITKPFQQEEVLARVKTHLDLRHSQASLRRLNQELQEANANKDTFFSILAHDLRGPFTILLGLIEAMIENFDMYDHDKLMKLLGGLQGSAKTVYTLLENLLTWSRLQRGVMEYEADTIYLDEIANHNVYLFQSQAEQKQIRLTSLIPEDMTAYGDNHMINTVVRNLLSNALKFTDAGGVIKIAAMSDGKTVEVMVSDTGRGISPEDLPKLFRIDIKFSNPGTANEQGTGLGLMLCQELVEKNKGQLWIDSTVGKGATFHFTLPQSEHSCG